MRVFTVGIVLAGLLQFFVQANGPSLPAEAHVVDDDSLAQARERQVQDILRSIAGKEELPASDVFDNIEIMKQVPAGRLLRIMDMGFGRSLGVGCEHCHDIEDFTSDDKRPKLAAREMMGMVRTINEELLSGVEHLERERPANDRPTVNCTTCHRGDVKPALEME